MILSKLNSSVSDRISQRRALSRAIAGCLGCCGRVMLILASMFVSISTGHAQTSCRVVSFALDQELSAPGWWVVQSSLPLQVPDVGGA